MTAIFDLNETNLCGGETSMGDFDVSNVSLSNREELHSRLAFELKVIVGLGDPAAGIRNSRLGGRTG